MNNLNQRLDKIDWERHNTILQEQNQPQLSFKTWKKQQPGFLKKIFTLLNSTGTFNKRLDKMSFSKHQGDAGWTHREIQRLEALGFVQKDPTGEDDFIGLFTKPDTVSNGIWWVMVSMYHNEVWRASSFYVTSHIPYNEDCIEVEAEKDITDRDNWENDLQTFMSPDNVKYILTDHFVDGLGKEIPKEFYIKY